MNSTRRPCSGTMSRRRPRPGTPCPVRTSHPSGICSLHRSQRLVKRQREITAAAVAFVEDFLRRPALDVHAPTPTEVRLVDAVRAYSAESQGKEQPLAWNPAAGSVSGLFKLETRLPCGYERDELLGYVTSLLAPLGAVSVREILSNVETSGPNARNIRLEVSADVLFSICHSARVAPAQHHQTQSIRKAGGRG